VTKLAAFLITTVAGAAGALLAGRASDVFWVAMAITAAWFAVLLAVAAVLVRRRRGLLIPVAAGIVLVGGVMGAVVGLPTLIGKTVHEDVVVGAPASAAPPSGNVELAAGRFAGVAHRGEGRAAVVRLASGARKLTLTSFSTASGPDLRVYLASGDPASGELGDHVDLGGLKGNEGDQQYDVPPEVDLDRHGVVVVWCRAFSVPFTSARLS
jgi:hypothetical protein